MDFSFLEDYLSEIRNEVIMLRRYFHRNPELSYGEYKTADYIYKYLSNIEGVELKRVVKTGVMAIVKGKNQGKVLAVRADIDGLPLVEKNIISYCSQNKGIMHACGHDGHMAMLIGLVKVMSRFNYKWEGEVRFLFQPAEEKHPGGAKDMIATGVLEGVDMIIASHLWVPIEVGKIGIKSGYLMAAPDNFEINIIGKGGHGAAPHETVNPVVIGAQVINALQYLDSQKIDPVEPFLLSVTQFHSGSAYNIIPEEAAIIGTTRSFNPMLRKQIPVLMERIIKGIAEANEVKYRFKYELGYEALVNDEKITSLIIDTVNEIFGEEFLEKVNPVMLGEDFSEYLKHIPGALFFIGAGNKEKGITKPHHNPEFKIDEDSLRIGLKTLVCISLKLLEN